MKRRYVVAVDRMTKKETDEFVAFLREKGLGWWHWINDFWLLVDRQDRVNAEQLREKLNEIAPERTKLVMEVREDLGWSGFGPNATGEDKNNMFRWLRDTWAEK